MARFFPCAPGLLASQIRVVTATPIRPGRLPVLVLLALAFVGVLLLYSAWIADDAFITFRVADNALRGFGLRWNIMERVQAYTHPLWLALILPLFAMTHELLWSVCLLSIALVLCALALVASRLARTLGVGRALIFLFLVALSKSAIAYGTSGLENPLSLLLLVALVLAPDERPLLAVSLSALLGLSRLDLLLVAAPIVLVRLHRASWRARIVALCVGVLPLVAWEIFSLVYYGSFVPNTALAKLGSGIPHHTLIVQGLRYYESLGIWDPVGALVLFCGVSVGLLSRGRALATGVLLYCVYLVWIGGDFMAGRFFSVPIVLATYALCTAPWPKRMPIYLAIIPLFSFAGPVPSPLRWVLGDDFPWYGWGIVDERIFYITHTGLMNPWRMHDLRWHKFAKHGQEIAKKGVVIEGAIGMAGFYAGPGVHIIDDMALADPLLARLPLADPSKFRPGHFRRPLPEGYEETIFDGTNRISDPELAQYYNAITIVTRAPIWSAQRWRVLTSLLTGKLDPLRDAYVTRHPPGSDPMPEPAPW